MVINPPIPHTTLNSYDVEYILMGNLTETQMDDFLDGMSAQNIRVNLKSGSHRVDGGKDLLRALCHHG